MAVFDLTTQPWHGAEIIGVPHSKDQGESLRAWDATLDIERLIRKGATIGTADTFQLLKVPANSFVLFAGAQVLKAFNGTTPTVDIDFAAGDDIVDGASVATVGFLASGANGQTNIVTTGAASTFTQLVAAEDTIDVLLTAGSGDVTEGVLRLYGYMAWLRPYGETYPPLAIRDQLA